MKTYIKGLLPKHLHPENLAQNIVIRKSKNTIISGPFKYMKYVEVSVGSELIPKLLGTYELELHDIIYNILKNSYDLIIDIGAAEGYYAVGLAKKFPATKIVAYECNTDGQTLIRQMAKLNGIKENLEIKGLCTLENLINDLNNVKSCLIILDAEGAENTLLDLVKIPNLKYCEILVEIHDHIISNVGLSIVNRFSSTHFITKIAEKPRNTKDLPFFSLLNRWILPKTNEFRLKIDPNNPTESIPLNMYWLHMVPKINH